MNWIDDVKVLVTHANCPDGVASAILVKDAFPDAKVLFMSYQSPELAALKPEPGMLFCDFTPPRERAREFAEAGVHCLDHHKSAREVVDLFGERGAFADEQAEPGVCGAALAFRHVWTPVSARVSPKSLNIAPRMNLFELVGGSTHMRAKDFAELAGIRDTWQRGSPRFLEASEQAEMLRFFPWEDWASEFPIGGSIFDPLLDSFWGTRKRFGNLLVRKHMDAVKRALEKAHRHTTKSGRRVVAFEGTHLTSDAAELLDKEVDLVVGFGFEGAPEPRMKFSLRSHTTFDCAALAKDYGGGGHTRAAGFDVPIGKQGSGRYWSEPFTAVENLLDDWGR